MARYLPNPVNQLMASAMHGHMSRRDIVKRGSALGLSSAMMATILRAGSVGAQGTPAGSQPAGYSIEIPADIRTDLAGSEISVVLGADGPGAPFDQATCDKFAEATGATVNYIKGAESTTDRLQFYQQTFSAESPDIDAAMIDVIWPGILAIHAVDLSEVYASQGVTSFERIVQNNTVDGQLVGIPWYTDAGLLYFRTDLLEKYGFSAPPQTWQELTDQAQAILDGESGANPSFTGFTFQGGAYEGLTCNALEWQFSYGGGTIVDQDANVTISNEQAVAAFELAKTWPNGISPQAVTGYKEEDGRTVWQGGNAAFMRNWPYAYSLGAADDSVIKDKFDVGTLPMGEGEGASHAATLGGWQMFVSKYSENQDAAKEFAKFCTSKEMQKARAIERSTLPTIGDLYTDPDVLAANPFFEKLFDTFESGAVARPSTATADLYNEVSTAYFTTLNEILTGQQTDTAGALEDLQGQIEDILEDL
jgi:trehalose/maltose transport system substrate-binding protein